MVLILVLYKAKGIILCINVNNVIVKRKVIVDEWVSLLAPRFMQPYLRSSFLIEFVGEWMLPRLKNESK